jgi:hypothetical protein
MPSRSNRRSNERGGTLVLVSVALFALLGVAALAIDLGMLMDARSEAQRAADAAALAGADAFRDYNKTDAVPHARDRSLETAAANQVRRTPIDVGGQTETTTSYGFGTVTTVETNNVTLNIIPDSQRVRVWVRPPAGIQTFFARSFGWGMGKVQAMATAHAAEGAPTTKCLKPFLIPDMWHEASRGPGQEDADSDGLLDGAIPEPDGGERWFYEPSEDDYYVRFGDTEDGRPCTGYGCGHGEYAEDWGTPLLLKPQTGQAQRQGNWYYTLDGEEKNLREQITNGCIDAAVGDVPEPEQGGKTGQVGNNSGGATYLKEQDPSAHWDEGSRTIVDSKYGDDWINSERVMIVGLFDPMYLEGIADKNEKLPPGVKYSNFVRVWLDDVDKNDNVMVRFLGFAPGGEGGPVAGTIVKRLQLIQ